MRARATLDDLPKYPEIERFRKFDIILELCHLRGNRLKRPAKPFWRISKKKKVCAHATSARFPNFGKVRGHEFFVRDSWSAKPKRKFWCFFSNSFFSKKTCEDTNLKHEHRMGSLMFLGDTYWFCKVGPWFLKVVARQLVGQTKTQVLPKSLHGKKCLTPNPYI